MNKEDLNDIESNCGASEPFALQVTDNSMEPEFNKDCIVIIDTVGQCNSGQYVFVEYDGVRWFRQYFEKDSQKYFRKTHQYTICSTKNYIKVNLFF